MTQLNIKHKGKVHLDNCNFFINVLEILYISVIYGLERDYKSHPVHRVFKSKSFLKPFKWDLFSIGGDVLMQKKET